jgi:hypothetical protein
MFSKSGIFLFMLLTSVAAAVGQQKTCKAKLAELPTIVEFRGFHLGMTKDQVKALVPQVKFGHANEFGIAKTSINPGFDPRIDKTNFADVRTISLDFLDGDVSAVWIGFENSFKWKTADEFVRGISQELSLPETWTTKGRTQFLNCADFQLSVSMVGGGPSLRLMDISADDTITQRRQEKEDNPEAVPDPPVVGDVKTKIFYAVDCEALKAVPEKNRVPFVNSAEAEKAGYKHADSCG